MEGRKEGGDERGRKEGRRRWKGKERSVTGLHFKVEKGNEEVSCSNEEKGEKKKRKRKKERERKREKKKSYTYAT